MKRFVAIVLVSLIWDLVAATVPSRVDTSAADGRSLRAEYGVGRKWALALSCAGEGVRITTASGRTQPMLAGWFVGRNDLTNHVATTVFVSALKCRDFRFATTLCAVRGAQL